MKHVEPGGLAYIDGQIRRGDRLISVNDNTLDGLDRKMVLSLLKNAGESVTLKMSRQVGHSSSVAPSLICSKIQSKQEIIIIILKFCFNYDRVQARIPLAIPVVHLPLYSHVMD